MSGSGIGVLIFGPLLVNFVRAYEWRVAMQICIGLSLLFSFFGLSIHKNKSSEFQMQNRYTNFRIEENSNDPECVEENRCKQCDDESQTNSKKYCNIIDESGINFIPHSVKLDCDNTKLNSISSPNHCRKENHTCYHLLLGIDSEQKPIIKSESKHLLKNKHSKLQKFISKDNQDFRWLVIQISSALSILTTCILYTFLKDWLQWIDLGEDISYALMTIGVGDMLGRLVGGLACRFVSSEIVVLLFGGSQAILSVSLGAAVYFTTRWTVLPTVFGFGFSGGAQMVLGAISSTDRGKPGDVGRLLLMGAFGAAVGPPLAGYLVDYTNSYSTVLGLCIIPPVISCILCTLYMIILYKSSV